MALRGLQTAQTSVTGAAGTIFIKTPGTNGTLIIDNNMNVSTDTLGSDFYTALSSADYTSTFDKIQLLHGGHLQMIYPSTFTMTVSSFSVDGLGGDELRVDGTLNTLRVAALIPCRATRLRSAPTPSYRP